MAPEVGERPLGSLETASKPHPRAAARWRLSLETGGGTGQTSDGAAREVEPGTVGDGFLLAATLGGSGQDPATKAW